jgi:hypothetical protein
MAKRQTINDDDRQQWVDNDEGLYDMYRASGLSMRLFIRKNRRIIDACIKLVRDGKQPSSFLKYGGV